MLTVCAVDSSVVLLGIHGVDFGHVDGAKVFCYTDRLILVGSFRANCPDFRVDGKVVLSIMHYATVVVFLIECSDLVCVVLLKLIMIIWTTVKYKLIFAHRDNLYKKDVPLAILFQLIST